MHFYDIHTHVAPADGPVTAIVNRYWPGETVAPGLYSAGLHPWYVQEGALDKATKWLLEQSASHHCVVIGEAGLDKITSTNWDLQLQAFEVCIECAVALQKPLIIHCVRAYDEVLAIKRRWDRHDRQVPWIFHGFNKKESVARQILDAGACLSFGAALLNPRFPAADALRICPEDRFFLETDDQTEVSIAAVYAAAAGIKGISVPALGQQMALNFQKYFTLTNSK